MHLAPKDVLVTIEVNLINGLDTDKIETVIDNIEKNVKHAIPYVNPAKVFGIEYLIYIKEKGRDR